MCKPIGGKIRKHNKTPAELSIMGIQEMTKHKVTTTCNITAIKNVFYLYWTQLVYKKDNVVWCVQCRIGRFWHAHRVITRTSHSVTNRSDRQVYVRLFLYSSQSVDYHLVSIVEKSVKVIKL